MLTRLKVTGFKNLMDVDIRFGLFTCIAGRNATGKSNLFDAIRFLSAAATETLMKAALSVRNEEGSRADATSIFHRAGERTSERMRFEAEMIVPDEVIDDLGMKATATVRFLRYTLELRCSGNPTGDASPRGPIEIVKEELVPITMKEADKLLAFPRNKMSWRNSTLRVLEPKNRSAPFISTEKTTEGRLIKLHGDGGSRGRPVTSNPAKQFRTTLSIANTAENPTVLCAKREMESWRLLQLEPAALRNPDQISASVQHMAANGAHLPATLYQLAHGAMATPSEAQNEADPQRVYAQVANRLSELLDDVQRVNVERSEKWDSLTLEVTDRIGTVHPARSLSDGTLRFLALTVLELDPQSQGVICLEEPENGIHPERIPGMLRLLRDIATDPDEPVDDTNPLRQIIINTHSPTVVLETDDDCLLVAESYPLIEGDKLSTSVRFSHLSETWRADACPAEPTVTKGKLLAYLNPISTQDEPMRGSYESVNRQAENTAQGRRRRVADRPDLQLYLALVAE